MGIFERLKQGLARSRAAISEGLTRVLSVGRRLDDETAEGVEEVLITADISPRLVVDVLEEVKHRYKRREISDPAEVIGIVRDRLKQMMPSRECDAVAAPEGGGPTVVLVIGVNGTGKTTSCAKLAKLHSDAGRKVVLAAADTFRAAAADQLELWAGRIGVDIVRHGEGGDPGAVVFDAADAALARGADYLIIDTAGRLHNKEHLLRELEKIRRVAAKKIPGAPHEVLLVLDATTGQNAVSQAKVFTEGLGVTGLVLAKLDGTAKGGVVISIWSEVRVPVKYVGVGEGAGDLERFSPEEFVDALFE